MHALSDRLPTALRYHGARWLHGHSPRPGRCWSQCREIYRDGRFTADFVPAMMPAWETYLATIRRRPRRAVWYDERRGVCFGNDLSCLNTTSLDAFLLTGPGEMLQHSSVGRDFVRNYFGLALGLQTVENDEVIYLDHLRLRRFSGAKLLLVGAGPTTCEVSWHPADYDYVWSCNHFYLSSRLRNIEVSLVTLGDEVDLSPANKALYSYLTAHPSLMVGFENTHRPIDGIKSFAESFPGQIFYAHGRYRGKIGTLPRLLCLAVLLGVAEIHVVGMDGMGPLTKRGDAQNHAFQENKPYGQGTLDYDVFRRHFVMLWDYVLNDLGAAARIRFQNLGEGHPMNQSTDISRQLFPLQRPRARNCEVARSRRYEARR
jgi:hypothetical protein